MTDYKMVPVEPTDLEHEVGRAIFKRMKPSHMIDADWDSGAILGANNEDRKQVYRAARAAISAISAAPPQDNWQPIESAPRDGSLIDLWCVVPDEIDKPALPGIRLTDVAWIDASEGFQYTGWVRCTDDGNYDLVEHGPTCPFGLPSWTPTRWQPRPNPPQIIPGTTEALEGVEK